MHDSQLTEEQRMIRDMARDFARSEVGAHAQAWEKAGWIDDAVVAQMGELGLLGMVVPDTWGGSYTDYVAYALAVEEISAGDGALGALMSIHNSVGCGPLLQYGSPTQQDSWLPLLASGQAIGCFCLTEPQAVSGYSTVPSSSSATASAPGSPSSSPSPIRSWARRACRPSWYRPTTPDSSSTAANTRWASRPPIPARLP
jgi:alkylation response protein AidB-like acyl-CoA dehydrogenase